MSNKKNEFEKYVPYEIKDIDSFKLVETSNKVLVEIYYKDTEETIGGIYTKGVKHFNFAGNTSRRGKVIKTCKKFVPARNGMDFTLWMTDVQIQEGDEVWFNYFDNLNSYDFEYEGKLLKVIPYDSIICAIRNKKVIMCNGYVLLEDCEEEVEFGVFKLEKKQRKQGIVRYIGKPNDRYIIPIMIQDISKYKRKRIDGGKVYGKTEGHYFIKNINKEDPPEGTLKEGDRVVIRYPQKTFYLEEWAYARFNKRKLYRVCQQYNIIAVIV